MVDPVKLNPQQQQAVVHGDGPLVVLAGAGTGKTRVLVHRIAHLLNKRGVRPREILAVTFTNKAAGEMKERLRGLVDYPIERMWVGTFHGIAARLLRRHGHTIGVPPEFTIFDDDDQKRVVTRIIKEMGLSDDVTPRALLSAFGRAKHAGKSPLDLDTGSFLDDFVREVYPRYCEQLRREKALDFGDLLVKGLELVRSEEVGAELADRFRHLLVDEFQDTNRVQYLLVKALARGHGNITAVGDDDQCIYGWRGAEPRNLLEFSDDFPGATIVPLEQNYRSTQTILDAANSIIACNSRLHPKRLWTDAEDGEPLPWHLCEDERAEATMVTNRVQTFLDEGYSPGDIAILYRKHAQSRILEEFFRRANISYRVVGGTSFFQRKEIKDILAYLRLALNENADSCFERIVNTPTRGIGKTTLGKIQTLAQRSRQSYWQAAVAASVGEGVDIGKAGRRKLAAFVDIINGLRNVLADGASVAELAIQCVDRSGYRKRLEDEDTPESRDRLANLAEFVSMASDFDEETNGEGSLHEFDERFALSSAADDRDGRGQSVSFMTVHAAKGLEFPIVFLVGLEDGIFPSLRGGRANQSEEQALQEERRLAYVAITRAMQQLVLSSAMARREWGEMHFNDPSRFLDEIPDELLETHASARQRRMRPVPRRKSRLSPSPSFNEFDQSVPDNDLPVYDISEAPPSEPPSISPGTTVKHKSFGPGRVLQAEGRGGDAKLLINFKAVGLKTVVARFVEAD